MRRSQVMGSCFIGTGLLRVSSVRAQDTAEPIGRGSDGLYTRRGRVATPCKILPAVTTGSAIRLARDKKRYAGDFLEFTFDTQTGTSSFRSVEAGGGGAGTGRGGTG